jgi:hypothetical protein
MTGRVKAQATHAYGRDLCLARWVRYVQTFLLATIWYTAQIFPAPETYTRQLSTAIAWYMWQGVTFSALSTLQKPKKKGGWALLDVAAKCRALLVRRMWVQRRRGDNNGNMLKSLGPSGTTDEPTKHEKDTEEVSIFTALFTRQGLYCTTWTR